MIISLLIVGIGVLSIPVAVDLVQTQTNLRSQATGTDDNVYKTDRGPKTVAQMKQELTVAGYTSMGSLYSTYGKPLSEHSDIDVLHAYLQAAKPVPFVGCVVNQGDMSNMPTSDQSITAGRQVEVSIIQIPGEPEKGCYYTEMELFDYTDTGDPLKGDKVCKAIGYRGNDYAPDRVRDCSYTPSRVGVNKLRVYYGGHSGGGCSGEPKLGTCEFTTVAAGSSPSEPTSSPQNPAPTGSGGTPAGPSDPTNLRYVCMSSTQAKLIWKYNTGAARYIVRVGDQSYDVSSSADSLSRPSKDVTIAVGQSYNWSVQAVLTGGGNSQQVSGPAISCR